MRLLLENDLIRTIFGSSKSRFRMSDIMNSGKVLVVDNSQALVGAIGCRFLGRYIVSQIWEAATARALMRQDQKRPVYVYIDEAQLIIDAKIAAIIDECRSQKIALVLAHQRKSQVDDDAVLGALENCAIKMVNVGAEASYFSKLLHIPEERMNELKRGLFATHISEEGSSISEIPLAKLPFAVMTAAQREQLSARVKSLYGSPEAQEPTQGSAPSVRPQLHSPGQDTQTSSTSSQPRDPEKNDNPDAGSEWS